MAGRTARIPFSVARVGRKALRSQRFVVPQPGDLPVMEYFLFLRRGEFYLNGSYFDYRVELYTYDRDADVMQIHSQKVATDLNDAEWQFKRYHSMMNNVNGALDAPFVDETIDSYFEGQT